MEDLCHRFRAIHAVLPTPGVYEFNDSLGGEILPALLYIVQSDNRVPTAVHFENAPCLTELCLENISYNSQHQYELAMHALSPVAVCGHPRSGYARPPGSYHWSFPLPFYNHVEPPPQVALTSLILDGIIPSGYPDDLLWFLITFQMPHLRYPELAHLDPKFQFSSQFFRAMCPPAIYPALRCMKVALGPLSDVRPKVFDALPMLETLNLTEADPEPLLSILKRDCTVCPDLHEVDVDGNPRRCSTAQVEESPDIILLLDPQINIIKMIPSVAFNLTVERSQSARFG
ncbi:hypothetical protein C8R43DRAFT_635027 [Mycena crocata]|nr:hypothetical protein C8R43DRAFT_635027 [Mycena crocata]